MNQTILIATTNNSKFELISTLLISCGFNDYKFNSLKDLDLIIEDKQEVGSILERAKQKAIEAINAINNSNNEYNFDSVIGIDDGIEIKQVLDANVKKLVPSIINNELLIENEIVYICRAFYFYINKNLQKEIITKIPFKYKQWKKDINFLKENSYPLSYVLSTLNNNIPVIEMNKQESNEYYKYYCEKELIKIKIELEQNAK